MYDFVIALIYVGILITPAIVATISIDQIEKERFVMLRPEKRRRSLHHGSF